jgi:aryl-alcohol dehydrogenase-like predicted oxidoreductase
VSRARAAGLRLLLSRRDTAAVYGLGHSEEVVGRALRDLPETDRPYVFTKGGLVWDESDRAKPPRRVGSPASLRREVEASLRRLEVERIDLYQMHWPTEDGTPLEEYWQAFVDLRAEGKIRAAGLSNHNVAQLDLGDGDWRSTSPDFTGDGLARNLALADGLRPVAERHGVSVGAVAVAWTLTFPGVSGAIVGARSPGQVDGWLPAAGLTLDDKDVTEIAAAIEASHAGSGPSGPGAGGTGGRRPAHSGR